MNLRSKQFQPTVQDRPRRVNGGKSNSLRRNTPKARSCALRAEDAGQERLAMSFQDSTMRRRYHPRPQAASGWAGNSRSNLRLLDRRPIGLGFPHTDGLFRDRKIGNCGSNAGRSRTWGRHPRGERGFRRDARSSRRTFSRKKSSELDRRLSVSSFRSEGDKGRGQPSAISQNRKARRFSLKADR